MAVNRYYSSTAVDTTVASSVASGDTTIVVTATTGFPTSYPYTLALDYDTSKEELINVVGASGTTLTVGTSVGVASTTGRGVDGTTAQSHSVGASVKHVISGRDMREAQEHIAATTSVHGITDTTGLVTKTGTETLTNKTLTAPAISSATLTGTLTNSGTISGGSITGPAINGAAITGGTIAGVTLTTGSMTGSIGGNPTFTGTVTLPSTTSIGNVSATEIGYVDGVTSAIQTQMDTKASLTGTETLTNKTISAATLSGTTTLSGSAIIAAPYNYQSTPPSVTATGNLLIADMLKGVIVVSGSGGYTLTLPTGTLTDAGILSGALPNDYSFDWSIVNNAGGTITMAGGTAHTYTGYTTIAIQGSANSQARFRTRKTATNTFVTYRIA